ncbi:MarR family winged helix-turn-helix transcriptional regulator [Ideonella livida]|uniref:MarR family transcriptional regulator n=1 Tax=Ideonella livida TaxID=2707176 RepID=A0A7C9PEX4_9BURK|nr:MarR family transcriptional regulator [Ideonella livida]NDY90197.1 MarR family transcriptional regulator [Ideonella livida]
MPPTSAQPAPQQASRVLRQFRQVFNTVRAHFQQVEKHAGVSGAQLWALSLVAAEPGLGVGALAQAMDVHPSTASNLVRALQGAALLEARREGPDRRAVQLHLTPQGQDVLARAPAPFSGVLPQALAALDADCLGRLERDLAQLLRHLEADARAARTPLADL